MSFSTNDPDGVLEEREVQTSEPSNSTLAGVGEAMTIWDADEDEQVAVLLQNAYTDHSSFGIPPGMGAGGDLGDLSIRRVNAVEPTQEATSGEGGDPMSIWVEEIDEQVAVLLQNPFNDRSTFNIPAGFGVSGDTDDISHRTTFSGVSVVGGSLAPDGGPLTATATIDDGGFILAEQTVGGRFEIIGPPPAAPLSGENVDSVGGLRFRLDPSVAGVSYVQEGIDRDSDIGMIEYGEVAGKITDFNGDPVPGDPIGGPGYGDTTDESGEFTVVAPGDTDVEFSVLGGSIVEDRYIPSGDSVEVEFQYPRLAIEVVDADYQPIDGAPVRINDTTYDTNEDGRIELPTAPIGTYDLVLMDTFEGQITVDEPGEDHLTQFGPSPDREWEATEDGVGGIRLTMIDSTTGRPVRGLRSVVRPAGSSSRSGRDGELKLLADDVGEEVKIEIGVGDLRYKAETVRATLPENGMVEETIELDPQIVVSNT